MRKLRSYALGAVGLLAIACILSILYSQGLIGAVTSGATTPSSKQSIQANHVLTGPALGQTGGPQDPPLPPFKSDDDTSSTTQPTGAQGIRPTIPNAIPSYTLDDAKAYAQQFTAHGLGKISIDGNTPATIDIVKFITKRDLLAQYPGLYLPFSDDTLLCFVHYNGNFALMNLPYFEKDGTFITPQPSYYSGAHQIYDAKTGNLMGEGTGP